MKDIKNAYAEIGEYQCFGCSPYNEKGLRMEFKLDGDEVVSIWNPKSWFDGWIGVVHGGIQATLLDEIGGWIVTSVLGRAGVTSQLNVKYLKPLKSNKGKISIRAKLLSFKHNIASIRAVILNNEGVCCAEGNLQYYCYSEKVSKEKFMYPGKERFISPE